MDPIARPYYEVSFERDFLLKDGAEFQDWFSRIMGLRHPGDFMPVKPWGNVGDRGGDGYLPSRRTLFQVYAPESRMVVARTLQKINDDFNGALPYWGEHFDTWVFVHNQKKGLPQQVIDRLLNLHREHLPIRVENWGFMELRAMVFELAEPDLAFLLGNAPSVRDYRDLRFDDLRPLLQRIARVDASGEPDVRPVPSSKFQFNALSESVRALFMAAKPQIVGQTLSNWPDPTFGDSVAEAFRQRYQALKQSGMEPDEIFAWLQRFAGGTERQGPRGEAAIVTVLAYLFEQCDIFERPPNLDNAQ